VRKHDFSSKAAQILACSRRVKSGRNVSPGPGDIAYYARWGNLAIFIKDFGYSRGLVRLGRIESGLDALQRRGPLRVRMALVK